MKLFPSTKHFDLYTVITLKVICTSQKSFDLEISNWIIKDKEGTNIVIISDNKTCIENGYVIKVEIYYAKKAVANNEIRNTVFEFMLNVLTQQKQESYRDAYKYF